MRPSEPLHRRPLLKVAAGGVTALGAVVTWARLLPDSDGTAGAGRQPGAIALASGRDGGVRALDLPLGETLLREVASGEWRSPLLPTSTHSMVAATWSAESPDPDISIRSRLDGRWTAWQRLPISGDVPDPDSPEWSGTVGTELLWTGDADGIQVRVGRARPIGLTLVLLHPSRDLLRRRLRAGAVEPRRRRSGVPRPDLHPRAAWGADERWRDGDPTYNRTIRQVHVHHTVNSNTYSRRDVPGLIRGMYRYHTHNLGWSDIGYNFLVDRFGRIWTGRAGGAGRPVRGAHTLGFNGTSTGVACIGNFEVTSPTHEMLNAVAAVAAWKLDRYGRRPQGTVRVRSEGSDKYPAGRLVELPVIDGHRDTNDTACPGRHLYAALPTVRRRAKGLIDRYSRAEPVLTVRAEGRQDRAIVRVRVRTPSGAAASGRVVVRLGERRKTRRLVDGAAVVTFGRFVPLRPGRHTVTVVYTGNTSLSRARASTRVTVR